MSEPGSRISFQEKELQILRDAVDKVENQTARAKISSPQVKEIIQIVENYIRRKKLVCYGGTAINNILPAKDQFYDKAVELPDYDFFSPSALNDAKELADIYYNAGYGDVEAKSGVHSGTYKVYVNFIPVADITSLDANIYKIIHNDAILVNGIKYAPANFLRMSMYLELSRPNGDVGRWEKVLKRLILLNKYYPLKGPNCDSSRFMREWEGKDDEESEIYNTIRRTIIDQGLIFFGGYASSLYGKYMPKHRQKQLLKIPDFDVLSEDAETSATIIKEQLESAGVKKVSIHKKGKIGENIPAHIEIIVDKDTVCFIYEPIACHSYNRIRIHGNMINVATIDTMLSFYLAFLYTNKPYYDNNRIMCMAQYLFQVQARNRLQQKGLLKRFTITCFGKQSTLEDARAEKAAKFKELKNNRDSDEYEKFFLRYIPSEEKNKKTKSKKRIPKKPSLAKSRKISHHANKKKSRRKRPLHRKKNTFKKRKKRGWGF